ncbi:leukocyte immunoglobulin-like receptor subfamily A member 2 [Emydura macquarii macquarii]|uniref:leukocyte immunoglobulin-like receptor subfamily A member 2 n=1 Tax=Emydura macquarii macquarii TaxID=1129001 RepID=UPI00352BB1B3
MLLEDDCRTKPKVLIFLSPYIGVSSHAFHRFCFVMLHLHPEGLFPKPNISISPSGVIPLGGNVTIRCWHLQYRDKRFLLYKDRNANYLRYTDPAGSEAEFPIRSSRREQRGSYTCRYSNKIGNRTLDVAYSEHSDPVQIIVAELSYPKLSVSLSPSGGVTLGGAGTLQCRGQRRGLEFVLYKTGQQRRSRTRASGSVKLGTGALVAALRGPHCPIMASGLIVLLLEGLYPKPNISVSPSGVIPVGGNVIIRCWHHQYGGMRFFLYKDGDGNYPRYTDPAGSVAKFPIRSVRREQRGNYTCRYTAITVDVTYSEPSDPVQIIVAAPSLPRPSISLRPTWVTAPGADVTIRCQGQCRDVRFFLRKAGDLNLQRCMDPTGAEFCVNGTPRVTAPGADVTIRCQGQCRDVRFFLCKAGDLNLQRCMDPTGAEFCVNGTPRARLCPEPGAQKGDARPGSRDGVTRGADVTIRCQGQCRDVRFFLRKAGDLNPQRCMDPTGAEFCVNGTPRARLCPDPGAQKGDARLGSRNAAPPEHPDFTHANIARLGLGAMILLVLGLILAEVYYSCPRGAP